MELTAYIVHSLSMRRDAGDSPITHIKTQLASSLISHIVTQNLEKN